MHWMKFTTVTFTSYWISHFSADCIFFLRTNFYNLFYVIFSLIFISQLSARCSIKSFLRQPVLASKECLIIHNVDNILPREISSHHFASCWAGYDSWYWAWESNTMPNGLLSYFLFSAVSNLNHIGCLPQLVLQLSLIENSHMIRLLNHIPRTLIF